MRTFRKSDRDFNRARRLHVLAVDIIKGLLKSQGHEVWEHPEVRGPLRKHRKGELKFDLKDLTDDRWIKVSGTVTRRRRIYVPRHYLNFWVQSDALYYVVFIDEKSGNVREIRRVEAVALKAHRDAKLDLNPYRHLCLIFPIEIAEEIHV